MLTRKVVIFVEFFMTFFGHTVATEYSCEVFQKDHYTAEYGGKCYVHREETRSFQFSKNRCKASGGDLAKLKDADQYDYVMNGRNYVYRGQKRDTDAIMGWIDAKKVNGKLLWTNGELITYSKPFYNGDQGLSETHCILTSRHLWEAANCERDHASFLCEHDKQPIHSKTTPVPTTPSSQKTSTYTTFFTTSTNVSPSSAKPTTIFTPFPSTAVSVQAKRVTVQREMTIRVINHVRGVLNPKLKLKPDEEICTTSLTECVERCWGLTQACQLFNFFWEKGECLIYGNKQAALETGANFVIGWRVYERY